jgi:mannose-6-phosphate isomerase-like protein (cupin superfamily)
MSEGFVRRVVTGHDENGKAIVISDGPAPKVHSSPLRPGHVSTDLWRTNEMPARVSRRYEEPTAGPRKIVANPHGTIVRISSVPPEGEWMREMDTERAKQVFTALGNPEASTFGDNKRHPFMHRTETIDYAIILEGEMYCVLDDTEVLLKAGDVLIQCGTNHAWSNRSDKPCKVAFILIDGKFDPELAAQFGSHP